MADSASSSSPSSSSVVVHAPAAAGGARPLSVLRELIDDVDERLVALLNERAALVQEVGRRKIQDGSPVYAPHREQAVLAKVINLNRGPLLNVTLEAIFRELMSGSLALERPLRIGYLGPPGSFSHEAANRQFGSSVSYENLRTIDGVFEEVGRGHVDYGLVPCENATIGSVAETLEGFMVHADRVAVCAEVQLSVAQALIACPGAVPADIRIISSKPEAIAQCRRWLSTQYPHAQLVPAASTSAAVEAVAKAYAEQGVGARHTAAIGSRLAAAMYDLPVMFPEVQDVTPNITRFFVLCSASTAAAVSVPSGDDKTAMLLVCYDRPGSLRNVLDAFARHDINLAHIDRRPCPLPTLARLISVSGAGQGLTLPPVPAAAAAGSATTTPAANGSLSAGGSANSASAGYLPALVGPHNNNAAAASTAGPAPAEAAVAAGKPPSPTSADGGAQLAAVAPSLLVPSLTGGRGSTAAGFGQAFFIEAVGHAGTPSMAAALAEVSAHCVCVKVLGSFPRARRVL